MKKKKCLLCEKKKGTRLCERHNNEFICPLCCSKDRNANCDGCHHYAEAKKYAAAKSNKSEVKHFIAEINEEVEDAVDHALTQVGKGDIEKGEFIITELEKKHPRNHNVLYGLGVVHAFKEQHDKAIEYFNKAISIFPFLLEAHFNKGIAYQQKLDIGNMIKSFKEVIAIGDPDDNIVKMAKTSIFEMEQSILKNSGIDLDMYIRSQEEFNEAFSSMEKQEWQNAIDGFNNCLSKNKEHPQSYGNIGICYGHLGKINLALAAFDNALKIDPDYEPALINKLIVESLKEGQTLAGKPDFQITEYYKDYPHKKKSLVKSTLERIAGK